MAARNSCLALLLGVLLGVLLVGGTAEAATRSSNALPKWVKPLLAQPHPAGEYLHEDDKWLALRVDVDVSEAEGGGLNVHHSMLLRSLQDEESVFSHAFSYDDASELLVAPTLRSQNARNRWVNVKPSRNSVEIPRMRSDFVTADRRLLMQTRPVPAGGHVFVSWSVIDKDAFPGEQTVFPLWDNPVLRHRVRVVNGADVRLLWVQPGGNQLPQEVPELVHAQVPAAWRLNATVPWQQSAFEVLSHGFVTRRAPADLNWQAVGQRVRGLLDAALAADAPSGGTDYRAKARSLTAGLPGKADQIVALAAFVQGLNYRNIEWGIGAFMPDTPSEVLRTASGDCKAKTLLLQAMLREIGVNSTPVLARLGETYSAVAGRSRSLQPAHAGWFNHMVLAIDAPAGVGAAARLTRGVGSGWLLFDPTDELATFGLPPNKLRGTPGVWLADNAELFEVALAGSGDSIDVTVRVELDAEDPFGGAVFNVDISGAAAYTAAAQGNQNRGELAARLRRSAEEVLRRLLPEAQVEKLDYQPPNHRLAQPVGLTLTGRIDSPLRRLNDTLYALPAPMALVRHSLAVGTEKLEFTNEGALEGGAAVWDMPLCCAGSGQRISAAVELLLPKGWVLHKAPRFKRIDAAWARASTELDGNAWRADVSFRAGQFQAPGVELAVEQRVKDLNHINRLWRSNFVLRREGG